ncbi:unnamed protein product [Symbiodinium sp. CCMP2592]|nr:unnamed protein product [Symbiodinium sp. CCMP2592]
MAKPISGLVQLWQNTFPSVDTPAQFVCIPDEPQNPDEDEDVSEEALKSNAALLEVTVKFYEQQGLGQWPVEDIEAALKLRYPAYAATGDLHTVAILVRGCIQSLVRLTKKSSKSRKPWLQKLKDACGPSLLKVKKRKSSNGLANPDEMETQVDGAGRRIPRIQAPNFLPDVIACLEAHDRYPFDHSLQYKIPFRKLHGELKKGIPAAELLQAQAAAAADAQDDDIPEAVLFFPAQFPGLADEGDHGEAEDEARVDPAAHAPTSCL